MPRRDRTRLYDRSGGACDWCSHSLHFEEMHAHHRLMRSHGGTWCLANIVALHPDCHRKVHGNPDAARARGFTVRGTALAGLSAREKDRHVAEILILVNGVPCLLDAHGGKTDQTVPF